MGQIVRRKRKGRPSNSDRARRNSPVAPPSPVDRRSSRRRRNVRYNFDIDDYVDDDEFFDDYDVEIGRREKKIRLLLCEDDDDSRSIRRRVSHEPSSSSSEDEDVDDDCKPSKKRKVVEYDDDVDDGIEEIRGRKFVEEEEEEEGEEEEAGGLNFICGTVSDIPKGLVSMPDKKTLELILDKLQKKDIYGVYAQPVDPDELPDYYDVIKHPMDFATVRKKLTKGSYLNLKELENDVLLICSNAMQYNAPDTIYHKQASSIQEQAKQKFQRLRANNVDRSEIELKMEQKTLPTFLLPKKQLKKSVVRTPQDPGGSETLSGATVKTGEFPNGSSAQTLSRANSVEAPIAENSPVADNNLDKDQEPLSGKGYISKLGRKPSVHDENRRATYNIDFEPVTDSDSIFSTFEGESKQFIPVGLHADHSYARSLARFAATLGSIAWKVASHTIEQALPEGVKYGRGWVGEYEPLSTPVLIPENRTLKEPTFFAIQNDEKAAKFTAPAINKTPKMDSGRELPAFFNPRIPVKQESFKEAGKNPIPKPFFPSSQANHGLNLQHQNSPQVELNHPPPMHASAAGFVPKRPISSASDIPSPRPSTPVSRNRNLSSLGSFKHSNTNSDGFSPGRPSKTAGLDCKRMAPIDNNMTHRQEGKLLADNRDSNRMIPMDNNIIHRQEGKPLAVNWDSNRIVQEGKPLTVNQDFNRMVRVDNNMTRLQEGKQLAFNQDCNRMVHMDNNINRQQEQQPQGLNDPVHMMKILTEQAKHQMNNSNGFGFAPKREESNNAVSTIPQFHSKNSQIYSKRDDSNNVSLTAAQAWMSLGAGGVLKPPLAENINPHKQQISPASMFNRQQPQVSQISGVHFQQPVKTVNEGQLQNRNVGFPQMVTTDLSRFQGHSSFRGANPQIMQVQSRPKQQESCPPDLNIGYQSMGVDSQQPDLALQL